MSDSVETRTRSNVTNRLFGDYQAKVISVEHPRGLYMVSVRVLGYWDAIPDEDLPFAEFLLPIGAKPENGEVKPVEVGDLVWVDFPRNGDTRYPRITGSLYYAPDERSNLPPEVNGEAFEHKRHDGEPVPPAYERTDILYDRFGLREHRTATGGWNITHKATGTAVEITPNGDIVIHAEGNAFRSSTGNTLEQVDGNLTIKVKGNVSVNANGNVTAKAGGNATIESSGSAKLKGSDVSIESSGMINVKAGGPFMVKATNADFMLG